MNIQFYKNYILSVICIIGFCCNFNVAALKAQCDADLQQTALMVCKTAGGFPQGFGGNQLMHVGTLAPDNYFDVGETIIWVSANSSGLCKAPNTQFVASLGHLTLPPEATIICGPSATPWFTSCNTSANNGTYYFSIGIERKCQKVGPVQDIFSVVEEFKIDQAGTYTVTYPDGTATALHIGMTSPNPTILPTLTITQPDCTTPTGTVTVSGFDAGAVDIGIFNGTYGSGGGRNYDYYHTNTISNIAANSGLDLFIHTTASGNSYGFSKGVTINRQPVTPATPTVSVTQPTTATPTGTITVNTPASGVTYSFDGGVSFQTSNYKSGLSPNDYTVVVKNTATGNCVSMSTTATVDPVPGVPTATITTPATCDAPTANVQLTNLSGYNYSFVPQGQSGAVYTAPDGPTLFTGLTPGDYQFLYKMLDYPGPPTIKPITITAPTGCVTVPTLTVTHQPTCDAPQSIVTLTGGSTDVAYLIDGTYGTPSTDATITGLLPGMHTIYFESISNNYQQISSVDVKIDPEPTACISLNVTQPACGETVGTISFTGGGGSALWGATLDADNSDAAQSLATPFKNVAAGGHTVYIYLNGTLYDTKTITVTVPNVPADLTNSTVTVTQPTCTTPTGTISIAVPDCPNLGVLRSNSFTANSASTGNGPCYSFSFRSKYSNSGPFGTENSMSNLSPGPYKLFIKDIASGCVSKPFYVTVNPVPTACISVNVTQPACGETVGTISFTGGGGFELWGATLDADNSDVRQSLATPFENVAAGDHTVYIYLNGTLYDTKTITINAAPVVPATPIATLVQPTCTTPTGSITVTSPANGVTYDFGDGAGFGSSNTKSGLAPGNYTVVVKSISAGNCTASMQQTINAAPAVPATPIATLVQTTCGTSTGSITVTSPASGVTYDFGEGAGFGSSNTKSGLAPGTYTVVVKSTSAGNCTASMQQTINAAPIVPATPIATLVQPTCDIPTGSITVTSPASGVTYDFGDGAGFGTSNTKSGLAPGTYTVVVKSTSAGNCTASMQQTINPAPIVPKTPSIFKDGEVLIASPETKYQWYFGETPIPGETNQTFYPITYGDYKVKVTNALGCSRFSDAVHSDVDFANNCPQIHKNFGAKCDDGNPNTINDKVRNDCKCRGDYYSPAITTKCPSNMTVVSTSKYGTIVNWDEYGMFKGDTNKCSRVDEDNDPNDPDEANEPAPLNITQTSGYYSGYPFPPSSLTYIEYIATDACGNKTWCSFYVTTTAVVKPNSSVAPLTGNIKTENNQVVSGVSVNAEMNGNNIASSMTTQSGTYSIDNLAVGYDYQAKTIKTVLGTRATDVTTYDIALVYQHILGIKSLDGPYKIIAADVDRSGEVDATDLLYMRRFVLGITSSLPTGTWRFVDKSYAFKNPANPFCEAFPENVSVNSFSADKKADFVAIEIGDVNNSYEFAPSVQVRTAKTVTLNADDREIKAGNEYTIAINANELNATTLQGTFSFNGATVTSLVPGNINNIGDGNFNITNHVVTTSWNSEGRDAMLASPLATFANITFKAEKPGKLSDILSFNSSITKSEARDAEGNIAKVQLKFNTGKTATETFALYQNVPNPADNSTRIGFNLPNEQTAQLTIVNMSGQVVFTKRINGKQGFNEVNITKSELKSSGVLQYRLDTPDNSATKRMIVVE